MSSYLEYRRKLKLRIKTDATVKGKGPSEAPKPKTGTSPAKKPEGRKSPEKGLSGKNRSKIKKASKKRAKELREYKPIRNAFLKDHPTCEVKLPGCQGTATQIHHQSGRSGKKLLDVDDFLSACQHCHDIITEESRAAIAAGHSKSRLGKANK